MPFKYFCKLILVKIIKYAIALFEMSITRFRKQAKEILILMYHRVNDTINKELAVKEQDFHWQMRFLQRKKYQVISMGEAYERVINRAINGKYIVLTFDDGYEDFYYHAYPVLKKKRFPAIVYLIPGYIETNRVFWWDNDIGESKLLTWAQIDEIKRSGQISFGSHTLNHIDMDKLTSSELRNEIQTAKEILEEKLGQTIEHFSYPRGIYTETGVCQVKENHLTGVLISNGEPITDQKTGDSAKLKRIPIHRSDGKFLFIARINGWLVLEETLRKFLRRKR